MCGRATSRPDGERIARLASLLAWFTVLLTVVGCTSVPPRPPRIAAHPLDEPGTPQAIAVVATNNPPRTTLLAPLRESQEVAKSAAGGAAAGLLTVYYLAPLALLAGPAGILALPAIMGGGAAVGLAAGTAAGLERVVPKEEAEAIERLAKDGVGQLRLPEVTAEAVEGSVKKLAGLDADVIAGGAEPGPDWYRTLRGRGFGAAIEVRLKEVGFVGTGSDPIVALFMTAEAKLIDTASGQLAGLRGLVYVSPERRVRQWAGDGAVLTKAEMERGYRTLAERVVEDLVLRAIGDGESDNVYAVTCGLVPRRPRLQWAGVPGIGAGRLTESSVESVTPMLEWEPAGEFGSAADADAASVRTGKIAYDLRIWNSADGAPVDLVYERQGLPEPQHRVETALEPGSIYLWSVRTRYVVKGRTSVTRWSAANAPMFRLGGSLRDAIVYSYVADGTVHPVRCPTGDLYPCRWLDFIPAPNYYRFRTP